MNIKSSFTILLISAICAGIHAWSYSDIGHWPATCRDTKQSPIDVSRRDTVYDDKLANNPLLISGFEATTKKPIVVTNNGHTVVFSIDGSESISIEGGDLSNNTYNLLQFHFHWGKDNMDGSEHTVDQRRYPLEVHFVFMRDDVSDFAASHAIPESLAVLGIFFEIGEVENTNFADVINSLDHIKYTDGNSTITGMKLGSLLPNHDHVSTLLKYYFTYAGSLTTPPCSQTVIWNLLDRSVKISASQMDKFRMISEKGENEINDSNQAIIDYNYRPTQQLNGRSVLRSFEPFGFAIPIEPVKQVESSASAIVCSLFSFVILLSVSLF